MRVNKYLCMKIINCVIVNGPIHDRVFVVARSKEKRRKNYSSAFIYLRTTEEILQEYILVFFLHIEHIDSF